MFTLGSTVVGLLLQTGSPAPSATETSEASELSTAAWLVQHDASAERRRRIATGAVRVGVGALQTALGLYVLLGAPGDNDQVRTSGVLNTAAGGGLILHGTLELARRGPLESVTRQPGFANLDDSSESRDWLLAQVRKAARRGHIERNVSGSLSLAAGLTIVGLGIANLANPNVDQRPAQTVLGATEVAAGLGFSAAGIGLLILPSQAERTLQVLEEDADPTAVRRRAHVRVLPTLTGVTLRGRF